MLISLSLSLSLSFCSSVYRLYIVCVDVRRTVRCCNIASDGVVYATMLCRKCRQGIGQPRSVTTYRLLQQSLSLCLSLNRRIYLRVALSYNDADGKATTTLSSLIRRLFTAWINAVLSSGFLLPVTLLTQ